MSEKEFELPVKTISHLIEELQSFSDQNLIVMSSEDGGETYKPVKFVAKSFDENDKPFCALYSE